MGKGQRSPSMVVCM